MTEHTGTDQGPIDVKGTLYSRGDISRGTGLSMSHISKVFSGQRMPSIRTASRICAYLQITLDDLTRILGINVKAAPEGKTAA